MSPPQILAPMKLNLGCGNKKKEGFIGVDRYFCAAADVICDLTASLPFADESIEEFYLDNVIEHVLDIPAFLRELVRVAKDGAKIIIITPHFSSLASWRDPTHLHHLSYFSMDHFDTDYLADYLQVRLKVAHRRLSFGGGVLGLLGRLIFFLSPETYEKKFCFLFRASTLRFALQVNKGGASPPA
jgi:SAM-dependent methyltransferase